LNILRHRTSKLRLGSANRQLRRLSRVTATLLAAALLAVPLLETAHESRIAHVTCPEDGELIDAPVQARHAHAQESLDGPQLFPERDSAPPSGTGSDHEHCIVALQRHLRARENQAPQVSTPVEAVASVVAAAAPTVPARAVALYRLAPKSGPPQA
jgi:hypothetical protein